MSKFLKISILVGFISLLLLAKYIAFDYPISSGKRVGYLTKLSLKGTVLKTWEGTLSEGMGDKLTNFFSIRNEKIAKEMYEYEGREVIIFYEEYFAGWPRDTNYNVVSWQPKFNNFADDIDPVTKQLSVSLFCSLLGTLITNESLYQQVKAQVEKTNPYLFSQMSHCNSQKKDLAK